MATKYFCDDCGNEMSPKDLLPLRATKGFCTLEIKTGAIAAEGKAITQWGAGHWCHNCIRKAVAATVDAAIDVPSNTLKTFDTYQARVVKWVRECFGEESLMDKVERRNRFMEEVLEFAQALGYDKKKATWTCSDIHVVKSAVNLYRVAGGKSHDFVALRDYVYNRPKGNKFQEAGGVMVTLAALAHAMNGDLNRSNSPVNLFWHDFYSFCKNIKINSVACGEEELRRVWSKIIEIRNKQAAKPKIGPLPVSDEASKW